MITIAPAARADIPTVSAVLASTFQHDTVMGTLVRGERRESRLAGLFRAMLRSGTHEGVEIDVAHRETPDGAHEIIGAAIWEPPGRHTSLLAQLRELPEFLRALGVRGVSGALRVQNSLARHRPLQPHWYLAQIGVGPAGQGAGVGTALLADRLRRIDDAAEAAYLESSNPRNRKLYARHGFTTLGAIRGIPHAAPAAMWRAPVRLDRAVAAAG